MNRALVDRIAGVLLFEGYLSHPDQSSAKDRRRRTPGGLYPRSYVRARGGSLASEMQTQCLVRGGPGTALSVSVRFLQPVARRVGEFDAPMSYWPTDQPPPFRYVESIPGGEDIVPRRQDAVERDLALGDVDLGELAGQSRWIEFSFAPGREYEPVSAPGGRIAGVVEREQRRIAGAADLSAEAVGDGLFRVTVRVENRTSFTARAGDDRDEALLHSLISTHTILGVEHGTFVSLFAPPDPLRELAGGCRNLGTWPVLVGAEGEADTLLSSPIVLDDYPQVAPKRPGTLFAPTEAGKCVAIGMA
jgi:hypothetical protein